MAAAVLLVFSLSVLAWLTLHWGILPRLDQWRPRVEAAVGERLGLRVQIGALSAHSSGWVPAFHLQQVVLRDPLGREVLRLPRVSVALSVPSLLALRPRLSQLLVEAPQLQVRRDAQGRWWVAGLDLAAPDSAAPAAADVGDSPLDWLLSQGEVVVRGGQVRWVDEARQAPPLALREVQLVLRNQGRRHQVRLDATPPPEWGQRFQLVVQARQSLLSRASFAPAGDWRSWTGQAYLHLPDADVALLRRHVDLPVDLQHGRAALRAWLDWDQARPDALTLDWQLRDVRVALLRDQAPLALRHAAARLQAQRQRDGFTLALSGLQLHTDDGLDWAPSQLSLRGRWADAEAAAGALVLPPPAAAASVTAAAAPVTAASATPPSASPSAVADPLALAGGTLQADRLDLATLAALAERLPLGAGLRRLLLALQPQGQVQALDGQWDGPPDAPTHWRVKAGLRGMAMAAAESPEPGGIGRPGWRGADLDLQATEAGGQAALRVRDGAMVFPGVFEQPEVPLREFSAQLQWQRQAPPTGSAAGGPQLSVALRDGRFVNDDAQGRLNGRWHTGDGQGFGKGGRLPGVLSLDGVLTEGQATAVARYLPLGISADTRGWVQHAVRAGRVQDVAFRVQGDLWDFPFVNKREGEFRIAGQVRDATLAVVPSWPAERGHPAYVSPWPAFEQVSGALVFERNAMQFQGVDGRLWGMALKDVSGRIRELSDHAVLEVEGQAQGPAADLLRYVRSTPVNDWTGQQLAAAQADGPASLRLALNLPLARLADSVVRGEVQLAGADLRLGPDVPPLQAARGRLSFTHRGLQLHGLRAQLLGGEAQLDGGTQADGGLRVQLSGNASAEGLRRAPELGPLAHWARVLQGQAPYRLQLAWSGHGARPEALLTSNLQGLAIDLPPPLAKPAEAAWPLRVQTGAAGDPSATPAAALPTTMANTATPAAPAVPAVPAATVAAPGAPRASRELVRVELGPVRAAVLRGWGGPGGAEPQVLRSAWSYAAPLPDPVAGGRAVLQLPAVDLDRWRRWLDSAGATATAPTTAAAAPGMAADATAGLSWPASVELRTPELRAMGHRLSGVTLGLQRAAGAGTAATTAPAAWQAQLSADQAAGQLLWQPPGPGGPSGRLRARLEHLSWPPAEASATGAAAGPEAAAVPGQLPALEVEVARLTLGGQALGRLQLQAGPVPTAGRPGAAAPALGGEAAAAWRLDGLKLELAGAGSLNARGLWSPAAAGAKPSAARPGAVDGAARQMSLQFELDVADAGRLVDQLGFGRTVQDGRGQLKGELSWPGAPWSPTLATLDGRLSLQLGQGRFLKADAGAARLLGVLSLQALPRRLKLDFRDLFQEGFAFDELQGTAELQRQQLSTRDLRMSGLQAAVLLEGHADLARETQNLHVLVLPELNTASASLAYAAIHPVAGLGALVGQWLLRDPLQRASAREFRITGSWADPQVQRIERGLLDPLPPHAQPASAAAASAPATAPASAAR